MSLSTSEVREIVARYCPESEYSGKKTLLIIPDGTRTGPVGAIFKALHAQLGGSCKRLDILVALGTHQPMTELAICQRLEITIDERRQRYSSVRFFNHAWDDSAALTRIGVLTAAEVSALSEGRFSLEVPVEVNRRLFEYDQLIIVGPVFPHEVVGFSGGNKYLFPGVAGPQILNFFHWLGAVVTNPMIIGRKRTPVRAVVDKAGAMVQVPKLCFALVVDPQGELQGLFAGTPEQAWEEASELSRQLHITYKEKAFHTIVSCAPPMYDELWTAGKCMYKLEPVLADGGELIIHAPHLKEICASHGRHIEAVGYHCRDYFLKQWDKFKHVPWGVLAHSTHVRGVGTFVGGVERCRATVTLSSQIPEKTCQRINLMYRDPRTVRINDYANREAEGILLVPKGGEMLFQLTQPPAWAGGAA